MCGVGDVQEQSTDLHCIQYWEHWPRCALHGMFFMWIVHGAILAMCGQPCGTCCLLCQPSVVRWANRLVASSAVMRMEVSKAVGQSSMYAGRPALLYAVGCCL